MAEFTTVREGRHAVKHSLRTVWSLLKGRYGVSKEEQVLALEKAAEALTAALADVQATKDLAAGRDFEAHQAEKDYANAWDNYDDDFEDDDSEDDDSEDDDTE